MRDMGQELINEIVKVIKELYPKYAIYTEAVRQGLKQPCFFVTEENISDGIYRGRVRRADITLNISYYPKSADNMQSECREVAEELYAATEYISTDYGILRCLDRSMSSNNDRRHRRGNMSGELLDEEYLSVSVSYGLYYVAAEDEEDNGTMEEMSEEVRADG